MASGGSGYFRQFVSNYGMVFVLMLLLLVFSVLTLEKSMPAGREAGHQLARSILSENPQAVVFVAAGESADDRQFVDALRESLERSDGTLLASTNGNAISAKKGIEAALSSGTPITHLALSGTSRRWTVFENFEAKQLGKHVTPQETTWPVFARTQNLINIANNTAIYAIIAVGMTMVIITGGIDLSVGSLVALAAVTAAVIVQRNGGLAADNQTLLLAATASVGICGAAGGFLGIMVTRFRIPPFIVSLSLMQIARGLAFRLTDGKSISAIPERWTAFGGGSLYGIPMPVFLMIVLYAAAHILMSHTSFGRYVYAVGGNQEAARLCGVPVRRVLVTVYVICGALAGIAGLILSSKLRSGDPKIGNMLELEVISAVVVGGTSLMGGEGRILGTLIGAFIIAVISNGMNLLSVDSYDQRIIMGAVLLAAVLIDNIKRKRTDGP
jgi:ribose transport system permease protein